MLENLKYIRIKGGYAIRSEKKFGDVAKVYEPNAIHYARAFCSVPELETVSKKVINFLEILLSAESIDQESFKDTVNKKYIKELCRELHRVLKKTE